MNQIPDDQVDTGPASPSPGPRNPLQIAWQRKAMVLLGVVIGLLLAGLFAFQRAPTYQSTAQVLVVKKHVETALPMPGVPAGTAFYDDYVSTHLALIRSQVVVDKAIRKHDLQSLPSLAGIANPTSAIITSLTATRDTKESGATNIINLSYKGSVPEDCSAIISAVIESYKDFLDETYRNVSDDTLGLITQARDLLQKDLVEKEKKYAEFREKAPVVVAQNNKDGGPVSLLVLGELDKSRLNLFMREAEIQERLKAIKEAKDKGKARELVLALTTAPTEKRVPDSASEQQLLALMLEEQTLLKDCGEEHPLVQAVREKEEMARAFLSPEKRAAQLKISAPPDEDPVEAYVKSLKQELATVQLTQQSLVGVTADHQKEARELARYEIQDASHRADIARTQQVYDQTIGRLKEINLIRDFGGYDAKVISTPGRGIRAGTGLVQFLLAGGVLGLLLGVGLAYLADVTDKSFRNPEEIRRRLGLPIVAHIPIIQEKGAPAELSGLPLDRSLAVYHRPNSGEAEAARGLRTALYFGTRGKRHKVIQITSPNMGDGKTTIASNLAIAIAQSGKRVVLVDADMRRPRLHAMFGIRPEIGLTSVIAGEAELSAAIVESGIDQLSLVTCGPRPANPAELLTQPPFEQILTELRERFDFVIVDTPPLLAVTDPAVVVSRMDGVFLVVRLSKNGRPAAERAREILHTVQAHVLGVVVNGVGRAAGAYGYDHYSYAYGYSYGYGTKYTAADGETNGHAENGTAVAEATEKPPHRRHKSAGWFGRWLR